MGNIALVSVLRKSNEIVVAEFPGEIVVLSLIDSKYYSGGDTAASVWALIDGSRTVADICEILEQDFEAPDTQIRDDVFLFLSELLELRLIEAG